jgi:hypothetical protein
MDRDRFPRQLLQQPPDQRIAYFEQYTMAHPHLVTAVQTLMQAISEPAGASLIFVFGPTGVGKTTLLQRVTQKLTEAALPDLEIDRGRIPITGIEAISPEFSTFDWKDFYVRCLIALKEPLMTQKINYKETKLTLRLKLEAALRNRRPEAFYIDEAQNLTKVVSGRKLRDQSDCLKSIANIAQVRLIPTGTYDLLLLLDLSDQLCRRSINIHFPRYHTDCTREINIFKSVVQTFQRQLPLAQEPDFLQDWDYCYERSLGCVGILKDWLLRTLSAVLQTDQQAETLTRQHLEQHAWSVKQCLLMLKAAQEGEEKLVESKALLQELRQSLGLELEPLQRSSQSLASPAHPPLPSTRQSQRPGKRRPKRDIVGTESHVE